MTDTQKMAAIALKKGEELEGFKILGIFPFYVKHLSMTTQIKICEIRDILQELRDSEGDVTLNDFYNTKQLKKALPYIHKLITKGLINSKWYNYFLYPFLLSKVKNCSNIDLKLLYEKLLEKADPSFFLSCYHHMTTKDHTVLKED